VKQRTQREEGRNWS